MKFITPLITAGLLGLASLTVQAQSVEVAGIKYSDIAEVGSNKLQLNGSGVRYKTVFQVYTAGLYLARKAHTTEEALAAPGAKRIAVSMLRQMDATELGKLFIRGVEDNTTKEEMFRLMPGLMRMGQIFSEQKMLAKGDAFVIDWVPGTGTIITVKGKPQGEPFKEPEFFNALLRIWLGNNPADWKLKDALLARSGDMAPLPANATVGIAQATPANGARRP
jgi:hypothetical protein